jgi:hypothetical protein
MQAIMATLSLHSHRKTTRQTITPVLQVPVVPPLMLLSMLALVLAVTLRQPQQPSALSLVAVHVHAYRITPLFQCCGRASVERRLNTGTATGTHRHRHRHRHPYSRHRPLFQSRDTTEFESLLCEYTDPSNAVKVQRHQHQHHRRIVLPSSSSGPSIDVNHGRHVVLASSTSSTFAGAAPSRNVYDIDEETTMSSTSTSTTDVAAPSDIDTSMQSDGTSTTTTTSYDPYANALDNQFNKIEQYKEKQASNAFETKLKSMDLQDIVLTLFIPGLLTFVAGRYMFQKLSTKVTANTDSILDNFANEMIYQDGDYKEMELCYKDYSTKLVYMGPMKSDAMIKRYLELYSKKKTVSPQAIVSLSYVFTIFQLSEEKAASILVQLCNDLGTSKISSIGKLLFLGTRILKSESGKQKLQLIKSLIMSTYRDERVAESLVETSQQYALFVV